MARAWLAAPETRVRLACALGVRAVTVGPSNVTWYDDGDFLAPHTDAPNGDFAFVWSLTKAWRASYGGNLHWRGGMLVPTFNRLAVFDVADNCTPHSVSPVAAPPGRKRLALSGWFRAVRV